MNRTLAVALALLIVGCAQRQDYVNARGAVHSVWVDEPSVIQITGIGPWEANFIDD